MFERIFAPEDGRKAPDARKIKPSGIITLHSTGEYRPIDCRIEEPAKAGAL
jgi:hypothetical protein